MFKLLKILSLGLLLFISCRSSAQVKKVPAAIFKTAIESRENPQLIDVRTPEEFEQGHLNRAQNINWNDDDFNSRVNKLDKNQPVYVYCQGGGRSASAAVRLAELGFKDIVDMEGGVMAWRVADLPLEETNGSGMSKEAYQELIGKHKYVLVDFYAEWCGPCKKMKPGLDRIAQDKKLAFEVIRIDVDEHSSLAKALGIEGLPTLKMYQAGTEVWHHLGYIEEQKLKTALVDHKKP
ncbi:MAG: redoxin domain-containing protein [Sphingobacteriales bacterium]|nr:MAG: redoxin domain-containing protein [Sphingobacteriales bacterium]